MEHASRGGSLPAVTKARRRFIQSVSAMLAVPLVGCGGGGDGSSFATSPGTGTTAPDPAPEAPLADTTSGKFSGQTRSGVNAYLGIPYAQPPVGALRFQSPKPVKAPATVVNADKFGAASLQTLPAYVQWIYPVLQEQSEDCLTVNVWAPSNARNAPIVLMLHGGAWRTGSPSMPLMNGQALAQLGVIVVTVSFRLGALGGLAHPAFIDSATGSFCNWQLQDQMAALQWVYDNAAAFGGDRSNICLVGQSAGGTSAALIAQNPATRKLLRKVVLLSPATNAVPNAFTLTDAAAYTELLAARLNTTPLGLRDVPAATLHAAELALNATPLPTTIATGRGSKVLQIVDGQFCLSDWTRTEWPAELPVIITTTLSEGTFFVDLIDTTGKALTAPLPQDDAQLLAGVTALTRSATASGQIVAAYKKAAMDEGRSTEAGTLWVEIYGDYAIRNHSIRYAGKLAAEGNLVRVGTYAHSIKAPARGVPHCADIPLLFGTYGLDFYKNKVGAGTAEATLSASMQAALVSFAKDAYSAAINGLTPWPRYTTDGSASVLFGAGESSDLVIAPVPKTAQLAIWDSVLGY